MELTHLHFAEYFRAVHGHDPFPWQERLVEQLAHNDEWPDVLDLPTASGKTAALDAAVFHLALRATDPQRASIRIALVVDRRLVVDGAYERATRIAQALRRPAELTVGRAVAAEVGHRLQQLAGGDAPPLVAARLRGGAPLEHVWARTPIQPTILCSTVDQVGSRLLFRGYGVSNSMRPVHAGLLGEGTLVLLDEAHLSEPFRQTLRAVNEIGGASTRTVLLTATPGAPARNRFALGPDDRSHSVLKSRIGASKPVSLRAVGNTEEPAEAFANSARRVLATLQESGLAAPAVGVVVNRVALARRIHQILDSDADSESILMIGRARGVDRDRIAKRLRPFYTGAETARRQETRPVFAVATQCLEVGVDLDLDGMVSQAAALDALRQRFGRLQRGGRPIEARGAVLALPDDTNKHFDDPVYGDRIHKTWFALQQIADKGRVDFGAEALDHSLSILGVPIAELAAPQADAPVLMPAYLELWAQTSPEPVADPEVGLFLHGAERSAADVSVLWRDDVTQADLTEKHRVADLEELLTLVPPRASEMIQLPLPAVRRWLSVSGDPFGHAADIADAPQRSEAPPSGVSRQQVRDAFRWCGPGHPRTGVIRPRDLRPADVIVLPAAYGGCDEFGWTPESKDPVIDRADEAAKPYRARRHAVRLRACRLSESWAPVADVLAADDGAADEDLVTRLLEALPPEPEEADDPVWSVRNSLQTMTARRGRITIFRPYRDGGAVLVAPRGIKAAEADSGSPPTTEHATLSHLSSQPVTLDEHGCHVENQAASFARALGLPDPVIQDVSLAAYLHDAGKADPRFQIVLSGGHIWNAPTADALAKSARWPVLGAWKRAGLPEGWRHEALSVRLARVHPRFAQANDPALVLWLVGTHHGHGRPFFHFSDSDPDTTPCPALGAKPWPATTAPGPESLAFDFDGADWPELARILQRRHGVWGLAFLEAVLRLADHRASEAEEDGSP